MKKLWLDTSTEKLWYIKNGIVTVYISINVLHLFNLLFWIANPFLRVKVKHRKKMANMIIGEQFES